MEYIDINKDEIPETFDIDLGDEIFTLAFNYNEIGDFFTVDLYKPSEDGENIQLVIGEKLMLNQALWEDIMNPDLPGPTLIPMDLSGTEDRISYENLGETVFLYIDDDGEYDE